MVANPDINVPPVPSPVRNEFTANLLVQILEQELIDFLAIIHARRDGGLRHGHFLGEQWC